MVLTLKRWKSRSSPGIAAGVPQGKNPFTNPHKMPLPDTTRAAAFVSRGCLQPTQRGLEQPATGSHTDPDTNNSRADKQPDQAHAGWSSPPPGSSIDPDKNNSRADKQPDHGDAGWSSPVARQAHNLKVAGSNPAPATNHISPLSSGLFLCPSVVETRRRHPQIRWTKAENEPWRIARSH